MNLLEWHLLLHITSPVIDAVLHALLLLGGCTLLGALATRLVRAPGLRLSITRSTIALGVLGAGLDLLLRLRNPAAPFATGLIAPNSTSPISGGQWTPDPEANSSWSPIGWELDVIEVALLVWGIGALVGLVRLGFQLGALHRHQANTEQVPAESDLARELARVIAPGHFLPELRIDRVRELTYAASLPRRRIVLGAWILNADPLTTRSVLAHELAHLRRRDPEWALLTSLLAALLWPLLPIHWLRRSAHLQSEILSDAAALEANGLERSAYIRLLASRATGGALFPHPAPAFGEGELLARLRWIRESSASRSSIRRPTGLGEKRAPASLIWVSTGVAILAVLTLTRAEPQSVFVSEGGDVQQVNQTRPSAPERLPLRSPQGRP